MTGVQLENNTQFEDAIVSWRFYQHIHYLSDLAALSVAWRLTFETRLLLNPYMARAFERDTMHIFVPRLLGLLALWTLAAVWLKSYSNKKDHSLVGALLRVTESTLVVSALVIVLTFFSRGLGADLSRSFVILFAPISFLCLVASLAISRTVARQVRKRWPTQKRVAVLGWSDFAEQVAEAIHRAPHHDVSFRGIILADGEARSHTGDHARGRFRVLGTTRQLAEVINRELLDRIIVASDVMTDREVELCGEVSGRMGVTVSRPIRPAGSAVQMSYQTQYGLHFIEMEAAPPSHRGQAIKRGFDMATSLVAITLLLPLFALLAALVKFTSEGPVFYRSQRVGKGGRYFTFWKFRSMYVNGPSRTELQHSNEGSGHLFKLRRDPRITPVGRIMRRLSFDELPQLFNVLAGDMSIVGPRPLPAEDLDPDGMSSTFAHWAERRAQVRPGITGLWQVRGRSDVPFETMMDLDLEYARNWSLTLDFSILLETPRAVLSGRGAY